ncbi:hypothetical protein [Chitinophaga barathri]|uniref:SdiA-regulated family protein n=1 Tax=Chitinophaga barathri TaxID=1647451 RepID=A0A3N4MEW2_9BACT|nr:hypothetical protein [Chitinophaga barathri]RPD38630.1 hypothetical protein EG028_23235 [Chitinophaga barathri]
MKMLMQALLVTTLISCDALGIKSRKHQTSPEGYNLAQYERFKVRESLQEISSLVFYRDENHFMANNDEQGKVFQVGLRTKSAYPFWKFGKGGDYEELVYTGKDWLVLKSNGAINQINYLFTDTTESTTYPFFKPGKRDMEAAYYDIQRNQVMVICKTCDEDKKQPYNSVYAFRLDSMAYIPDTAFRISTATIPGLAESPSKHFRPSGAAVHPVERRVYIVASVNELLVITDLQGNVLEAHHLPRKHFSQPEGITFAPNGDMYISNEGDDENTADILKFKYHPKN